MSSQKLDYLLKMLLGYDVYVCVNHSKREHAHTSPSEVKRPIASQRLLQASRSKDTQIYTWSLCVTGIWIVSWWDFCPIQKRKKSCYLKLLKWPCVNRVTEKAANNYTPFSLVHVTWLISELYSGHFVCGLILSWCSRCLVTRCKWN